MTIFNVAFLFQKKLNFDQKHSLGLNHLDIIF